MLLRSELVVLVQNLKYLLKYFSFNPYGSKGWSIPTSNSKPFSVKVWQQPPATSCCSRTRTFFPALAIVAAAVIPPIPLPIIIASRFFGIFSLVNPKKHTVSKYTCPVCSQPKCLLTSAQVLTVNTTAQVGRNCDIFICKWD